MKICIRIFPILIGFFLFSAFHYSGILTREAESNILFLSLSNKTVQVNEEVCLDVMVREFRDIMSMQYTMKWSPKQLKYKGVKGEKLAGLSENNFGKNKVEKGLLTFAWFDGNVRGISVPDGTSIYQVCFDVVANSGDKAYVQFTGFPTVVEISNAAGAFLDLQPIHGVVKVK